GDLRTVRTAFTDGNVTSGRVAPLELKRLNDRAILPVERAAVSLQQDTTLLLADNTPRSVIAAGVSQEFFALFGLPNTLGRGLAAGDFQRGGIGGVVISYRLWRDLFNSDPAVVGKTLRLADGSPTVAGVAPRDLDVPRGADLWFAMPLDFENPAHSYDGYLRV